MTFQQPPNRASKLVTTLLTTLLWSSNAHSKNLVDSAFRFFVGNDSNTASFDLSNTASFDLDRSRPGTVSSAFKAAVLKSLPAEGLLTKLKEFERQKLEALGVVLQVHHRESIYEVAVYESS